MFFHYFTVAPVDTWETAYDGEGTIYWYNSVTGVSQYEDPSTGNIPIEDDEHNQIQDYGAPTYTTNSNSHNNQDDGGGPETHEWQQAYDEDGNVYYYNSVSGISQYESPY